ncbi:MAG: phosphoglycerate kinase [Bacteroidota bacterium]
MKTIDDYNFSGHKALIRVDFNVPLNSNLQITDDSRILAAIPTIKKILNDGGSVILMSHLGRPKTGPEDKFSLKHIVPHLSKLLKINVGFADDCIGESAVSAAADLLPGEVLLLENVRFYKEETKGDEEFAKKLARLGDVYVNDAFGTAHRAHASTTILAKFFPNDKLFGYVMANELKSINKLLNDTERPFTAIMGGAKVSDKILLIDQLIDKVDYLLIGGGMSYTFAKAMGGKIGKSLVEEDKMDEAISIMNKAKGKIILPKDSIIADAFSNDAKIATANNDAIPDDWMGLDIGPETIKDFTEIIKKSKSILWNGPLGVFEMSNFQQGTKAIAEAIVAATKNGSYSLIGGGDSAAAINKFHLADQVSYVSTGGGALLEYIEGKELPGVKAILE